MSKKEFHKELFDSGYLSRRQFDLVDAIARRKVVSLYYELRTILYLGVLLFTSGAGILIYQHIGEMGHIASIIAMTVIMLSCFVYVFRLAGSYSPNLVKAPSPYFDYVLLLGALLMVAIQGYVQYQFGWFDRSLSWNTLITSLFFFFLAYRMDHLGILSLALTALASFWGLALSPQKWYQSDFFSGSNLHIVAIFFGAGVTLIALALEYKSIKRHFTFTYLNIALLVYLTGSTAGMFLERSYLIYLLLVYIGCLTAFWYARRERSFWFLIYAFVFAYVGTTYLLSDLVFERVPELWFYYSVISCGGLVYVVIRSRQLFKRT